jgi:hypothetical protein
VVREMESNSVGRDGESPAEVYSRECEELNRAQAIDQKRERRLGYGKAAIVLLILITGFIFLRNRIVLESLLAPAALFLVLTVLHEKVMHAIERRGRAILFYERGLARIEDRWQGTGETGDRFFDPLHPYARDLDIFGKSSLFELLCTMRTRAGEETLAAWLLAPAGVGEVLDRQAAIRDLKPRFKLRETLFILGEHVRLGVHPEALSTWGERRPVFGERSTRVVTTALSLLWILSLVCWGMWNAGSVALAMTVVNVAWAHRIHTRVDEAAGALEGAADDLELLAGVLARMESESFSDPMLLRIQADLKHKEVLSSEAIHRLNRLVDYLRSRHNQIARFLDIFTFWSAHVVFAAERWQLEFGPQIRSWLAAVGEFEALCALACYAFEHPDDVFPEFSDPPGRFDAEALTHPLLSSGSSVRNDVKLGDGLQLMILSGPNMAGKSTFIRSIGVNAVLAQCGAPVRARRLRLSPLTVAASICVLDSLAGGVSRFYAEIQRIKLISDLTQGAAPVLFLLDELLSGTNSHDRLQGTRFVVESLTERGAIGIVSTHDLALAHIPETMGPRAVNCHFEDRFAGAELAFDYKLKPGVVQTSNALELMRSVGLDVGR